MFRQSMPQASGLSFAFANDSKFRAAAVKEPKENEGIDHQCRRMMLVDHARYLPVVDQKMLMGVISFYDVAKSVVEAQDFENTMLKAYIRDWPEDTEKAAS